MIITSLKLCIHQNVVKEKLTVFILCGMNGLMVNVWSATDNREMLMANSAFCSYQMMALKFLSMP